VIQISSYVKLSFTYALCHSHIVGDIVIRCCSSHIVGAIVICYCDLKRADAHLFDTHKVFFRCNMDVITDGFSFERFVDKTFIWCIYKGFIFLSLNVYILVHTYVWFLQCFD